MLLTPEPEEGALEEEANFRGLSFVGSGTVREEGAVGGASIQSSRLGAAGGGVGGRREGRWEVLREEGLVLGRAGP